MSSCRCSVFIKASFISLDVDYPFPYFEINKDEEQYLFFLFLNVCKCTAAIWKLMSKGATIGAENETWADGIGCDCRTDRCGMLMKRKKERKSICSILGWGLHSSNEPKDRTAKPQFSSMHSLLFISHRIEFSA